MARLALAQSLKDGGGKTPTLADWIAGQPAPPSDPVFDRFEGRLTELALLSERQEGDDFETRLATALAPAAEARRSLLLDSLDLDLTAALVAARQRQTVTQDLRLTLAELTLLDTPAAQAITARAERPEVDPTPLLADAQARLAKARDALAAQARRAAVLQSLAGLGYEVGEGLVTAWVDQAGWCCAKRPSPTMESRSPATRPVPACRCGSSRSATRPALTPRETKTPRPSGAVMSRSCSPLWRRRAVTWSSSERFQSVQLRSESSSTKGSAEHGGA